MKKTRPFWTTLLMLLAAALIPMAFMGCEKSDEQPASTEKAPAEQPAAPEHPSSEHPK